MFVFLQYKNNLILNWSSMKSISQFRLKKLICHTEAEEQKQKVCPQHVYGSFLFNDRITNSFFKYQEAMQNLKDWVQPDKKNGDQLKYALRTYKFAKNFEMNCIRNKYYENRNPHSTQKIARKLSKDKNYRLSVPKNEPQSKKRDDYRKTINELEHSQRDFTNLMKQKQQRKKSMKTTKWWKKQQIKRQSANLCQNGQRIYDKAITHLQHEMKVGGEYLINVPIQVKRKNLIKQQFKKAEENNTFTETVKRYRDMSSSSPLKLTIDKLEFTPFSIDQFKTLRQMTNFTQITAQKSQFLKLVKAGYVNQALIEVKKRAQIAEISDSQGNNIFHLCVNNGNDKMCYSLLKALPLRMCQRLLQAKNNLGRTPLQKAQLLREKQVAKVLLQYSCDNKFSNQGRLLSITNNQQFIYQ